jgi:hypothetical protein
MHKDNEKYVQYFFRKLEGKRPRRKPKFKWEGCVKIDFKKKYKWGSGLDSSHSEYDLVVGFCEHGTKPLCFIEGGTFINWYNS